MTRLTAVIRDGIIENAIKTKKFAARDMAIVQERADFVERLRLFALSAYGLTDARIAEIKKQVEDIEAEVTLADNRFLRVNVNSTNYVWDVNLAGQSRRLSRNGMGLQIYGEHAAEYNQDNCTPHYNEGDFIVTDPKWREELDAIDLKATTLKNEFDTMKASLTATIKSFTTVEKLLEAWPDAKELIPENTPIAEQPGTGLAISVADLNAMCGIPTEAQ